MKKILLTLVVAFALTSCYNTRILVGGANPDKPMIAVNSQWCNSFLFGLISMEDTNIKPSDYVSASSYIIRTHKTFLNGLVSSVTFGLYTPSQTTFYLPESSAAKALQQKNAKNMKTLINKKY